MPLLLTAATNDLTSALQKGLFEEEANHNLDAAAQAYQAVSAQFDKDRKLAATAIFRLGEVYRTQGKTNDAVAQYERIVREFSDQETLATLSRQNLAGIGRGRSISTAAVASEPSAQLIAARAEVASLAAELEQLKSLSAEELRLTVPHNYPNPTLTDLMKQLAAAEQTRVGLEKDFAPEHPEIARVTAQAQWLEKQIQAQVSGTVRALEVKLNTAKAVLGELEKYSSAASPPPASSETIQTSTDDEEKVKEIRRLQQALFKLRWPTKTPEQVRRQIEAARTAQQEKIDAATDHMESLRVELRVPDDIAVMDADKAMDDPRLVQYRAYFEAKSTRDGVRRFGQVLYEKLATEEIQLDLFRHYDALDN
ncbi:MAG: hypothetical protein KIS67_11290 [Verrucomicrobiae bacterium]|nr:hypothetical protein [Verrucomicrobiae bacterium]